MPRDNASAVPRKPSIYTGTARRSKDAARLSSANYRAKLLDRMADDILIADLKADLAEGRWRFFTYLRAQVSLPNMQHSRIALVRESPVAERDESQGAPRAAGVTEAPVSCRSAGQDRRPDGQCPTITYCRQQIAHHRIVPVHSEWNRDSPQVLPFPHTHELVKEKGPDMKSGLGRNQPLGTHLQMTRSGDVKPPNPPWPATR
jgi:hypothetical protein